MSQSIIRKNNRSTHDDDDDSHSRYLTPRKYHTPVRTHLSNSHGNLHFNDNTKLLYNKYPVIIGDFTLTKPMNENSFYNYKPKHTNTAYVYQGIVRGSEVQERAMNEIKQYVQSSSPPSKKTSFTNNRKQYQSMLTLPSSNYRSTTDDDLIDDYSRDSIYESLRRRNRSLASFYPSHSVEKYDPYYFGEQSGYNSLNEEEESSSDDERCAIFGSNSQPKLTSKPSIRYSTFIPPFAHNNDDYFDVIFQEVADVGTSTDDLLLYITLNDRRDTGSDPQQSLVTNQSSRSETGVYRVSRQNLEQNNYEEPAAVPFLTVKHPASISTSSSSTIPSHRNPIQSDTNRSSKTSPIDEHENYYVEDDEEEEIPEPPAKPQRLPQQNPVVNLPVTTYAIAPVMTREPEGNSTYKSSKSDRSNRSFFDLFNRNKKKEDKSTKKKTDDKSTNKKKEKKKRKS
jgi:hypothetical protein